MILTLNAGSSSIKFGLYQRADDPTLMAVGQVENLGPEARLILKDADGAKTSAQIGQADHLGALRAVLKALQPHLNGQPVDGIGHRIVHGGPDFGAPAPLTAPVLQQLRGLIPLAPLHQPHNLAVVDAAADVFPKALQVGCFDTAFHRGRAFEHDAFALPRAFYDQGIRRYGFHGLSYDYIASCLRRDHPDLAQGRVVVAHLGNGASMCAMQDGRSVATTMGFSALEGLVMGTRSGQLDAGVLLYWLDQGKSAADISRILYKESGLLGLSGLSHDMRTLLDSDAPQAAQAVRFYVTRLQRELGAMTAALGGIDALVFCGGVGENAAPIRAAAVQTMGYLGLTLDAQANASGGPEIGTGPTRILVIPTDEEQVIARAVARHLP